MYDVLIKRISLEYKALGHQLGWRFLSCKKSNFSPNTDILLLSLNPAGTMENPDHPRESCESGSAYVVESWGGMPPGQSKLQLQIRAMFDILDIDIETVLSGQLVPFRSPSWGELLRQEESLRFGERLWAGIIDYVEPSVIIAVGKSQLRPFLLDLLDDPISTSSHLVNWGPITASVDIYENRTVVSLPHLSRFAIMTRLASRDAVESIFRDAGLL